MRSRWRRRSTTASGVRWEAALCSAGLGLVFQLSAELGHAAAKPGDERLWRQAFTVAALARLGLLASVLYAAIGGPEAELWSWLTGALLLAAALGWSGERAGRGYPAVGGAALLGFGLLAFQAEHAFDAASLSRVQFFELELALRVLLGVPSLLRRQRADHAFAAAFPAAVLLGLCVTRADVAIFDAFAEGSTLAIDLERRPSRDLTLSLGWAVYAGVLSALGMLKRSRPALGEPRYLAAHGRQGVLV